MFAVHQVTAVKFVTFYVTMNPVHFFDRSVTNFPAAASSPIIHIK